MRHTYISRESIAFCLQKSIDHNNCVRAQRRRSMFCWQVSLLITTAFATIDEQLNIPKVRSLSGSRATDGNNATNADVLNLLTLELFGAFAPRHVKQYNDRVYLSRYRRNYWLGTRYFHLDNDYYLPARDTCIYRMNETQRRNLTYEDGLPIDDVVYQLVTASEASFIFVI
ncbi:unnamed protein product [Toxocara canis]|uniref:Lipocalin n=1 Tax=Toxocara canis TaxID=6265 RepID=A0A183UGU1_TOXCA|nr:unnamed protein product [Toxocara canis]